MLRATNRYNSTRKAPLQRKGRVLFRDTDIIVAIQNHIRIASLLDAKTARVPRAYKTLHAPQVQFPIEHMVLNADGRLLAVAGTHNLAVVVLPSSSRGGGRSPVIECKSIQIAADYHGAKGSPRISKITWHPLGDGNTSLFALTADGVLREYDPTVNAEEPLQSFRFGHKEKKRNTFNADDPSSSESVSFAFGCGPRPIAGARGSSDWTPLTVFGLMKNGDIYAICPVCPSRIRLDTSYMQSLQGYVQGKEALAFKDSSMLVSPTPAFYPSYSLSSSTSSVASVEDFDLPTLYDHQRKYVAALLKQLDEEHAASSQDPPSSTRLIKDLSLSSVSTVSNSVTSTHLVSLRAPTTIKLEPEAQGPFRFQPSPAPSLTPEWDDMASDIFYSCPFVDENSKDVKSAAPAGLLLVAFVDGRVDIYLDLVKVEAVWSKPGAPRHFPSLVALETVDMGFMQLFRPSAPSQQSQPSQLNRSTLAGSARPGNNGLQPLITSAALNTKFLFLNVPTIIPDPIYSDTVYLQHSFGVHALWLGWVEDIRTLFAEIMAEKEEESESSGRILQQLADRLKDPRGLSSATQLFDTVDPTAKNAFPVVGLAVSSDLSVDYSMLALTSNHQAVPIGLQVRVPTTSSDEIEVPAQFQAQLDAVDAAHKKLSKSSGRDQPTDTIKPNEAKAGSGIISKTEPYRPVMSTRPFNFPAYQPAPRPQVPNIVVGRTEATPTQLREFAGAIAALADYHRRIQDMASALGERMYLLKMEQTRQIENFSNCRGVIERLAGASASGGRQATPGKHQATFARLDRVNQMQPMLLRRLDTVLQRLVDSHNGALTESEKAWFGELKRMKKQIVDSGDGTGLVSKVALLSKQLELLMPRLEDIHAQEVSMREQQRGKLALGTKQMLSIGQQLGSEATMIQEATKRITMLALKTGIQVNSPHVGRDNDGDEH